MTNDEYRIYLRRAETARDVRELRRVADDVKATYPDDPSAELIDQTCFMFAAALIERQAERRPYRHVAGGLTDAPRLRAV